MSDKAGKPIAVGGAYTHIEEYMAFRGILVADLATAQVIDVGKTPSAAPSEERIRELRDEVEGNKPRLIAGTRDQGAALPGSASELKIVAYLTEHGPATVAELRNVVKHSLQWVRTHLRAREGAVYKRVGDDWGLVEASVPKGLPVAVLGPEHVVVTPYKEQAA